MREHIVPAGYEFQKVAIDFERLIEGKSIFDRDALAVIRDCTDNNARYDALVAFQGHVLPNYDDPRPLIDEILETVVGAVEEARKTPVLPIRTTFGSYSGQTAARVADAAATIIDDLLYGKVESSFSALCRLFAGASNDDERKIWIDRMRKLARHDRDAWEAVGPAVQRALVDNIRALSEEHRESLRTLLATALQGVLSSEISGATATHETITLYSADVTASEYLRQIRCDAIDLLAGLIDGAPGDPERREIIRGLLQATHLPHVSRSPSPELVVLILEDARRVVELFQSIAPSLSYELLQEIEHDLLWQYRHNGEPPSDGTIHPDVAPAREALRTAILAFRDAINGDDTFVVYKTLVGFKSVFAPAWDDREFGHEEEDGYRRSAVGSLARQLTPETANHWYEIITRCARTISNDLATFPFFADFLEAIGREQPAIVLSYLRQLDDQLARFLAPLLRGLEDASEWPQVELILREWIHESRRLDAIAWCFRSVARLDTPLLADLLAAAMQAEDADAVIQVLSAAGWRQSSSTPGPAKDIALRALTYLRGSGDLRVLNAFAMPRPGRYPFLQGLTREEAQNLLDALILSPRIEYVLEDLLELFAASWPVLVISWFGKRLRIPRADQSSRYEAVPFRFHGLGDALAKHPDLVMTEALASAADESGPALYGSARLVAITFPTFPEELRSRLINRVRAKDPAVIAFAIQLLHAYEGLPNVFAVAKEFAANLEESSELVDPLENALQATGAVSGEFTRVGFFKRRHAEIVSWMDDPRDAVRRFASRFLRRLENAIAAEQKRATEGVAMRRLHYG